MTSLKRLFSLILVFICIFSFSCSKSDNKYVLNNHIVHTDSQCDVIFLRCENDTLSTNLVFKLANRTNNDLTFSFDNLSYNLFSTSFGVEKTISKNSEEEYEIPVFVDELLISTFGDTVDLVKFTLSIYSTSSDDDNFESTWLLEGKNVSIYPTGLDKNTFVAPKRPTYVDGKLLIDTKEYCLYYATNIYDDVFDGNFYQFYIENNSNEEIYLRVNKLKVDGKDCEPQFGATLEKGIRSIDSLLIFNDEALSIDVNNIKKIEFTIEIVTFNDDGDEISKLIKDCVLDFWCNWLFFIFDV